MAHSPRPNTTASDDLPAHKSLPTQARALIKRNALISAASTDFQEAGYEATTAKSIALRAGVATGTFYQYFHNKDDILRTIAAQRFEFLLTHVESPNAKLDNKTVTETFHRIITLIYDFHEQDAQLHQVLEQRRHADPHLEKILVEGEWVLEERVLRFVQTFNLPNANTIAFNLFAMAEGLVHKHVFSNRVSATRDSVIELGAEMLASYFNNTQRT